MRIAFSGKLGAGKSSASAIFQELAREKGIDLILTPFSKPIYDLAYYVLDKIDRSDIIKPRRLLEEIGKLMNSHPKGDQLIDFHKKILNNIEHCVIEDLRRLTQVKYLQENGFVLIRIEAGRDVRMDRRPGESFAEGDITDTELDIDKNPKWTPNFIIYNNGTYDFLKYQCKDIFDKIK